MVSFLDNFIVKLRLKSTNWWSKYPLTTRPKTTLDGLAERSWIAGPPAPLPARRAYRPESRAYASERSRIPDESKQEFLLDPVTSIQYLFESIITLYRT
jgi:hypothetical protein